MAGEIERLISNLESMDGPGQDVDEARAELSALRAENARLREALLSFTEAGCPCSDCVRARAALGGRDDD